MVNLTPYLHDTQEQISLVLTHQASMFALLFTLFDVLSVVRQN